MFSAGADLSAYVPNLFSFEYINQCSRLLCPPPYKRQLFTRNCSWGQSQWSGTSNEVEVGATSLHGFGSISRRRTSLKPMIAAVNGSAYGGGVEMILNCDLVVASQDAVFAFPEAKRGVLAGQGGEYASTTFFFTRTVHVARGVHVCVCRSNLSGL